MYVKNRNINSGKITWLVLLRIAIGWHFLYEGLMKILNPSWSSVGYLLSSKGFMAGLYHAMATNQTILTTVDFLNQWGLLLIGLGLILGLLSRWASFAGMVLLLFYYFSHPPFIGISYEFAIEGNYLIVDKIFIEFCALGVLSQFPTGKYIGLERIWLKLNFKNKENGKY